MFLMMLPIPTMMLLRGGTRGEVAHSFVRPVNTLCVHPMFTVNIKQTCSLPTRNPRCYAARSILMLRFSFVSFSVGPARIEGPLAAGKVKQHHYQTDVNKHKVNELSPVSSPSCVESDRAMQ